MSVHRPADESPGIRLTTSVHVCFLGLNRPVRSRLQGGVVGGIRKASPYPD